MEAPEDRGHSSMWNRFHEESSSSVVKSLRKSKSMDTLPDSKNWILRDIPHYEKNRLFLPLNLPTVPLSKWEVLLQHYMEAGFFLPLRDYTSSRSCPSLPYRPEEYFPNSSEDTLSFTVGNAIQSVSEESLSATIRTGNVSGEEANQFAAEPGDVKQASYTNNNRTPEDASHEELVLLQRAVESASVSTTQFQAYDHQLYADLREEIKGAQHLENSFLSLSVNTDKMVNLTEMVKELPIKDLSIEINFTEVVNECTIKDMAIKEMNVTTELMDKFEEKMPCKQGEEEVKLVKDKTEVRCKNKITQFFLEDYQELDTDLKYSQEMFDLDEDDDSLEMETQTILCMPFLCRRRKTKQKTEGASCCRR
eukprot:gi/632964710/ref/XP_007898529.1/ PREDICTED: uncharacterized protein LOC103183074 [Callorhinchus milii]